MVSQQSRGFTLVELMVVVVIIGVLAAIAIPNYQQYRIRTNRADAQAFLMDVAQRQQQYLMDARAYTDDVTVLGVTVPEGVARHYSIDIVSDDGPPPGFIVTASPLATSMQNSDGDLTIDQAGNKEWNGNPW